MKCLLPLLLLMSVLAGQVVRAQEVTREPVVIPLTPGSVYEDSLTATDNHRYTLDAAARQFVYGEVDQINVDVVVTIYAPDGRTVAAFDGPARGPEPFRFETEAAGTYRVEVTPFQDNTGRYRMTLKRLEPLAATPQGRVDQLMTDYNDPEKPGGVVVVVRNGEIIFEKGYGMANLEYGIANTPQTSYHMASVSKQFTAFAIAMLADQGKLSLEDDVRKHLPELPDFGKTITLRHLLNHTSGIRDQWSLWAMSGGRMDDVIRQEDLMNLIRRQRDLNFEPGAEHLYSNTGYMLLAEVVGRVTGKKYGEWMREQVFEPLGMHSTQIYDDHERIVKGRAYSYQPSESGFKKAVLSYANSGATSLFTTAEDLAKWLRNFHTAQVGGPRVIERLQERGILNKGDTLNYALGISIDTHRGLRRIQHGGADAGYRTMLMYYPEIDAGVIVLGNIASFNSWQIASDAAEEFFGDSMKPEEVRPEPVVEEGVTVAPALLDAYTGTFLIENGPIITFTRENDRLFAQAEGQSRFTLTALADTLFRVNAPGLDARVSFHREPGAQVEHGTLHQGGNDIPMRRKQPWDPDVEELKAYTGRYYSPELETFYIVEMKDDRLIARHRRHGDIQLTPTDKDAFRGGDWYINDVKFERNDAGAISGLLMSNGRVRNLRFEKQDG